MASTYSDLKIELIGTGEQVGTWGSTTNTNLGTALEEAITGSANVAFSSADVTITLTNTNGSQAARHLRLNLTGTSGGARNLILGSGCQIDKPYIINNGLVDTVTVKNTTGTGVAVPAGRSMWVFNNGTNVVDVTNHVSSLTLSTPLPVASGGTGAATLTGVVKGTGTSALTAGSVNLATEVTGTLPIANGGTGATVAATALSNLGGVTQAGARSALSFSAGSGAYNASTGVITIPTNNNQISNGAGYTTNVGTVTSVSGTGTASGLTLSGSFTTSGSLTLSGTVNSLAAGTYGISISGNAATATSATSATTATTATNLSTASGSAPSYSARAWVNFDNNGSIRASGNVSSVTKNGTGDFTINFTTAMPDANYAIAGFSSVSGAGAITGVSGGSSFSQTTSSCRVITAGTGGPANAETACVVIFR
jgi:hypothetical protein